MIKIRIQVEEMHVYYYIAKKLISSAKLGFMGFMSSSEEKLINNIYHAKDADEINDLSRKLFDKLEDEKTELKLNTSHDNLRNIEELIGEAVGYTNNLLFKAEVLENVSKTLKNDLTTHEKIMLCVDKISQAKRILMGLSPDERKNILDGKGFEIKPKKKKDKVKAVDEENVENVTEVELEVQEIESSEEVSNDNNTDTFGSDIEESDNSNKAFTAQDMPSTPIEHYMVDKPTNSDQSLIDKKLEKIEEEAEVLDWDEEEVVDTKVEDEITYEDVDNAINEAISSDEVIEEVNDDAAIVYGDDDNKEDNSEEFEEIILDVEVEEVTPEVVEEEQFEEIELDVEIEDESIPEVVDDEQFEEVVLDVEVEDESEQEEVDDSIELDVEVELPAINMSSQGESSSLFDIDLEPPMVYPSEETVDNDIVQENTDYAVPEIFKIIERDGVEVDEDIK